MKDIFTWLNIVSNCYFWPNADYIYNYIILINIQISIDVVFILIHKFTDFSRLQILKSL